MAHSVTVAICTHNRSADLERCLSALRESMGARGAPVIVVDNASSDNTCETAKRFGGAMDLRVVEEPVLGLSNARNRAVRECATEYIVFLDDDAIPDPGWFPAIESGIEKHSPDVFGGPYTPHYLTLKPAWFNDAYGSMIHGNQEGPLPAGRFLSGGNMGWRRSLLESYGGFQSTLGMIGRTLGLGEESQLQMAMSEEGIKLHFFPEMRMTHLVPPEKMKLGYHWRRQWRHGRQDEEIGARKEFPFSRVCAEAARLLAAPVKCLFRSRRAYPYWQNFAYEHTCPKARFWGAYYSHLLKRSDADGAGDS